MGVVPVVGHSLRVLGPLIVAFLAAVPVVDAAATPSVGSIKAAPYIPGYYIRYDENVQFLWGNLTWQDGQGRIVWGPVEEGTGGGGTPDPSKELQWQTGTDYEDNFGQPLVPYPEPDVFTSDPLPMRTYVNVSQSILLDLQIQDNSHASDLCGTQYVYSMAYNPALDFEMDVELLNEGTILGGAAGRNNVLWFYANPSTKYRPADPAGYSTCHFALSPEAAVLEAGAILRLRLIHVSQDFFFTYGYGGEHPSTIRIPLYPPEEVLYRYPDLQADEEEPSEESGEASTPGVASVAPPRADPAPLGLAGLIGIAGVALGPRRRAVGAGLLALVLVSTMAAGCLQKGDGGSAGNAEVQLGGQATQTFVKDVTGELVGAGGSILGEVYDDLHIPIGGVHVSILGFPDFTTTDGKGRFKFVGIAPSVYKLRFDKAEYKSFEVDVEVKAGFVSKPSVMLYLVNMKDRDFRPHMHDYWPPGATTKTLINSPVSITCPGTPPNCPVYGSFRPLPKESDLNTVLPGTYMTRVTFAYTEKNMQTPELGLAVYHAASSINASYFPPRPSGVPYQIATSWEMSDPGHSPYSYWNFIWIMPSRQLAGGIESTHRPVTATPQPDLNAKVEIERGPALPLEPKHPDDWAGRTEMQLSKGANAAYPAATIYPPGSPYGFYPYSGKSCLHWGKKIPEGTKTVEVTLQQSRATGFHWVLKYKPANIHSSQANYQTGHNFKPAKLVSNDGTTMVYKIDVKPEETDFIYAKPTVTGWQMCYEPNDYNAWYEDGAKTYLLNYGASAGTTTGLQPRVTMTHSIKITQDA